jgi:hypothetical protein
VQAKHFGLPGRNLAERIAESLGELRLFEAARRRRIDGRQRAPVRDCFGGPSASFPNTVERSGRREATQ